MQIGSSAAKARGQILLIAALVPGIIMVMFFSALYVYQEESRGGRLVRDADRAQAVLRQQIDDAAASLHVVLEGLQDDPTGVGHLRFPPRTSYFSNKEFENLASEDTKPLLITLHGLSGGSFEVYLRHVLAPLVAQTSAGQKAGGLSGGDWEALVVNSRGCAGSKITTSVLYNARATWDLRQTVKWCRKTWPNRPLFGIGYSLGANILTNVSTANLSHSQSFGVLIVLHS